MQTKLILFVPLLVLVGALIAPASFAGEKFQITANEFFNPLDLDGFPDPEPGEAILAFPAIACPGHAPTGNMEQPCPTGSRTHIRNGVVISRIESDDERVTGWMTVVFNANVDANFEGPAWGIFSIQLLDDNGSWEGTWQGLRVAQGGYWTAALNVRGQGYGGIVDGMKLMAVDEIYVATPLPIAYTGKIEARIIDPK